MGVYVPSKELMGEYGFKEVAPNVEYVKNYPNGYFKVLVGFGEFSLIQGDENDYRYLCDRYDISNSEDVKFLLMKNCQFSRWA